MFMDLEAHTLLDQAKTLKILNYLLLCERIKNSNNKPLYNQWGISITNIHITTFLRLHN